jgi:hypothetical protein
MPDQSDILSAQGMNGGIPLIKIADRVEITVDYHGKRADKMSMDGPSYFG